MKKIFKSSLSLKIFAYEFLIKFIVFRNSLFSSLTAPTSFRNFFTSRKCEDFFSSSSQFLAWRKFLTPHTYCSCCHIWMDTIFPEDFIKKYHINLKIPNLRSVTLKYIVFCKWSPTWQFLRVFLTTNFSVHFFLFWIIFTYISFVKLKVGLIFGKNGGKSN